MDKVDEILYEFNKLQKNSELRQKRNKKILIPGIILVVILFVETIMFFFFRWVAALITFFITLVVLWLWYIASLGRIGTQKWKDETMAYYRKRFEEQQKILLELIKEKNMSNQDVCNRLQVKYSRQPVKTDNSVRIISIASLVIAMTSVVVAPLTDYVETDYSSFIILVFAILILFAEVAYFLFCGIDLLCENQEHLFLEKNKYVHVMKLLEDYL